jgi:hypothetical protein
MSRPDGTERRGQVQSDGAASGAMTAGTRHGSAAHIAARNSEFERGG